MLRVFVMGAAGIMPHPGSLLHQQDIIESKET
jgi:hypothetical protein